MTKNPLKIKNHYRGHRAWIAVALLFVVFFSCERIVDIESPYPEKAEYCSVNDSLIGRWQSDSVWVVTDTDSADTIFLNKRPTYYYDLTVNCGKDTSFLFSYINYSGVATREAYSVNFESNDIIILLFDELDFDRDMTDAIFEISYQFSSDSTFMASYRQNLNANQRTETRIWMRRIN